MSEAVVCWNCRAKMRRTGDFYTCGKCGATETRLPDLGKGVPIPDGFNIHTGKKISRNPKPMPRKRIPQQKERLPI